MFPTICNPNLNFSDRVLERKHGLCARVVDMCGMELRVGVRSLDGIQGLDASRLFVNLVSFILRIPL